MNTFNQRRRLLAAATALPLLVRQAFAAAAYPSRPVMMVIPFSPGGGQDIFFRGIGPTLDANFGQSFIAENKPGGGGIVGAMAVKNRDPDGQILLLGTAATHGMLQAMSDKVPYDAQNDFTPVCHIANVPLVLAVNADLPVDNLAQFIELLKASPGKYAYGSSGSGAPLHLAGELFNHVAQVDTLHVPYKGAGPAMVDLLGGRITYMFDTFAATNAHVRAGKLKRLGVASDRRYKGAPQLHTLKEDGCNVVANTWSGIFAPAGTPKNIVDALNAGFRKTMADPSLALKRLPIRHPNHSASSYRQSCPSGLPSSRRQVSRTPDQ
jgi:tripartite-type tricarboxylate transporter receptor subunit TctC